MGGTHSDSNLSIYGGVLDVFIVLEIIAEEADVNIIIITTSGREEEVGFHANIIDNNNDNN